MSQILDEKLKNLSKEDQVLWALRHTTEHLLHTAMQNLYPKLKKAMGPATEEGFYFDFDLDEKITTEDFQKITSEMEKLIEKNLPMIQEYISVEEAKEIFKNNLYKIEWVNEIQKRGEKVSIFKMGDIDLDLCSGPHIDKTGKVVAFKLLSVAGAYWHGDEKNKMLQRVYGTSFPSQKELDEFLERRKLAEESDHRKVGKDLNLFVFADLVGKGLPLLTPKGSIIRRELERFVVDTEIKWGYNHVYTPPIAKTELYKTSGHYPYYKDTMYPVMKVDEDELILRPMTCPHHFMLFESTPKSYRELPLKIAEISPQFRYEKSGELSGLMRVRTFTLSDSHIFASKSQASEVIKDVLNLIDFLNEKLGFKKGEDYRFRLSLGDRADEKKYYKDDGAWDYAENVLREVLKEVKAPFYEAPGEAAFYGPKIDVQIKKVNGSEETAFTVQYDFVMPKRFKLKFINSEGLEEEPIVIHRASIGAIERTMAFLIEKYKGSFPVWLSPTQVKILPLTERNVGYAKEIMTKLKDEDIRVELDDRNETLGAKIRNGQNEKVPYLLIVGDKEEKEKKVALRQRSGKDMGMTDINEFISEILSNIKLKSLSL